MNFKQIKQIIEKHMPSFTNYLAFRVKCECGNSALGCYSVSHRVWDCLNCDGYIEEYDLRKGDVKINETQ